MLSSSILHVNIRSLRANHLHLEEFVATKFNIQPSFVCLTEHWLNEDELSFYQINNYAPITCFCRKNFKNGGCLILTANSFVGKIKIKENLNNLSIEKVFECAAIETSIDDKSIVIVCIYRPPSGNIVLIQF